MTRFASYFLVGVLVGIFRAFVLLNLWNWFVTAVFHVSAISFLQVLGLSLAIQLFTGDGDKTEENVRWGIAMRALELCIPAEKMEDYKLAMKEMEEGVWSEAGIMLFSQVFGNAFVLGFGFVIHWLMGVA
jgi:hypothetical protein